MDNLEVVLHAISEKKGYDTMVYDCRSLTPLMDTMVVVSTNNVRQNNAILQNIKDRLKEQGYQGRLHIEGKGDSRWILMDLGDIVVHVFVREERQVYQLDRLYRDVPAQKYDV